MSTRPVIFISAVSKELHSARDLVAKTLISLGYEPKWQDIAATETGMLPEVLRKWIDDSEAVLQLVGHCYGFAPKEADADFGVCSYTQLEALYARKQGKPVYYILLDQDHPTDSCIAEASALRDLQDAYRVKVTGTSHLYHPSSSLHQTELIVRRMKNELAELRKEEQARQERLHQVTEDTQQKATEILAGINNLKQQAQNLPRLAFSPQSWPQPAPFHNRTFPDQKNFVGRDALLGAMKETLDAGKDVALTQPVAMHGAGGIGKTRAAVEFARANGSSYTLRLFLDAQSPEALRASLAEVARKLELTDDPQASAADLVLLALRLLRAVPSALVVADNADPPESREAVRTLCHEPGDVRWLITTRLTNLGDEFHMQPVDLLEEADAVKLLQRRGRRNGHSPGPDAEALAVAIELGRLPLALQQAGAYVARQHLSWTAYSKLLADNPAKALSHDAVEMKDVPESILRTYTISLKQISKLARVLLEIAAHLAPAPIPEDVFLHADSAGARRDAVAELAELSLIEWSESLLEVHRAIAIAVCHDLGLGLGQDQDAARRTRLELACQAVEACAPKDMQYPNHWPAWAALRPHIEHLLAGVGPANAAKTTYAWLLASFPNYLTALGEYVAAVGFYRTAIACEQYILGAEHRSTLASRMNLANALDSHGKHAEAEQEHRAVLKIKERMLGAEHPSTLTSQNNLANALISQGRYFEAEQELRTALQISERVLDAEHHDTLSIRNNLAMSLDAQGRHAEAEQEYRVVLQISERVLGFEHRGTLSSRNNLAIALNSQGRHAEAEQEQRTALQIRERVLGAEHPETLASRVNLTATMRAQGRLGETEQETRTVLQHQERVLGTEHPETLMSRMNLAIALAAQGKHVESEQEMWEVLQIRERVLGDEHPDVALSCYNLALCLETQHKLPEALKFMKRAEQVRTKVLGPDLPDTKRAKAIRERIEAALK